MKLPLAKLNYQFSDKPLLVGGMAMEYYGLRKAGNDIDLIVPEIDIRNLLALYPERVKDLWGDLGVCPFEFEIWKTIRHLGYEVLKEGAIEEDDFLVISKEKMLLMKVAAMEFPKYQEDARCIALDIIRTQGVNPDVLDIVNRGLVDSIPGISYIERKDG